MQQIKQQNSEKQDDMEPLPATKEDSSDITPDNLLPVSNADVLAPPGIARQGSTSGTQPPIAEDAIASQQRQQVELLEAQQSLQKQHMLLKHLEQQQAELMEQQQRLQQQQQHVPPQTQHGQQLQQQQVLLQQLQQQFQQQQLLLQQELIRQSQALQSRQAAAAKLGQMSQGGTLPQVVQTGGLDDAADSKHKRRAPPVSSEGQAKKSLERQLSGLNKRGKQVRARSGGKGKRLSELESQLGSDDHVATSSDPVLSGGKRPAGESVGSAVTGSLSAPPAKEMKLEGVFSASPPEPSTSSSDSQKRVLEQGDADHTTSLVPSNASRCYRRSFGLPS